MTEARQDAESLRTDAARIGVDLDERQVERLLGYRDLLVRWNRAYNLTAVRDPEAMRLQHLLDCLAVVPPLRRQCPHARTILDVGSGGGLPGVVLAVVEPAWQVTCVDAVGKKAAFVQQVAGSLGLSNLKATHSRVEQLQGRYDVITARAFASLAALVHLTAPRLAAGGTWMAMKGQHPQSELDELAQTDAGAEVFHVEPLVVPGLDAERCLVWVRLRPTGDCP